MIRRFRKSDITAHGGQDYFGPAVNVKVYKFPHDLDGISAAQSEFGCTAELAGKALEYAYEVAQRDFWHLADMEVQNIFGPTAKACSMGRSGGWLYVDGIGASTWREGGTAGLPSWSAAMVAKWGRLVRYVEAEIASLTSWESARESVAHYLDMAGEEAREKRVRDAAPELLAALKQVAARLETVLRYHRPDFPESAFIQHPDLIVARSAITKAERGKA